MKQQIGVIGLGVMGRNLALNIANKGFSVSVYNRTREKTDDLIKLAYDKNLYGFYSPEEFVSSLLEPRKIIIMVKAGDPVDGTIDTIRKYLSPGDIIIDGGNSFFKDTIRRSRDLEKDGIKFIGAGISGGEEGALLGPAIMPGGQKDAYEIVEPILTAISAHVDSEPCCTYIGSDGAGHYVKMVHNGIEYGDMQLIGEAYFLLKNLLGLSVKELHEVFSEWNKGELDSYLIDITQDIFTKYDAQTGIPMIDLILDSAGQKGTGKWTSQSAIDLGVPTPTITEAVYARFISSIKKERVEASTVFSSQSGNLYEGNKEDLIEAIRRALYASKICSYAQGLALMKTAEKEYGWELNLGAIAMIFRGGCIIRAQFLQKIKEAYDQNPNLKNLMLAPYFKDVLENYQEAFREVICLAVKHSLPIPAFSSALAYFDSYKTAVLPANLLQAQRDYFGAHTYERVDIEGFHHYKWY